MIGWPDAPSDLFRLRSIQVAAICTGNDPAGSGWVLALFPSVPGRRGVARRAGLARRSRHRLEVGPALCPGPGTTFTLETQLNQRQLARGRDLYPGQGQVGVFIPRGGFDWGD